jgi:hypothetical protein
MIWVAVLDNVAAVVRGDGTLLSHCLASQVRVKFWCSVHRRNAAGMAWRIFPGSAGYRNGLL